MLGAERVIAALDKQQLLAALSKEDLLVALSKEDMIAVLLGNEQFLRLLLAKLDPEQLQKLLAAKSHS